MRVEKVLASRKNSRESENILARLKQDLLKTAAILDFPTLWMLQSQKIYAGNIILLPWMWFREDTTCALRVITKTDRQNNQFC